MAKKIEPDMPFDEMENQCLFTRAALRADRIVVDLLPTTDLWLGWVAAVRAMELAARTAMQEATASRVIANLRLDDTCRSFGRSLSTELKNDRSSARWHRFFHGTVDDFVSQPLVDQAAACIGWLETPEPVLEAFRGEIGHWAHAAEDAIKATNASAQTRGAAMVAREELAEKLTRARDGLHAALVARAQERNLPRDFADGFFIVSSRKKGPKTE